MRTLFSIALWAVLPVLFATPIGAAVVSGSMSVKLGQLPSFTVPVQGVATGASVTLTIPDASQPMAAVGGAPFGPGAGGGTSPTSPRTSTSGATWAWFHTLWSMHLPPFCSSSGYAGLVWKLGVCRSGSLSCDNHALITAPISSTLPLLTPCLSSGVVTNSNVTSQGTAVINQFPWVKSGPFLLTGSRGTVLTTSAYDNRTSMGSMGTLQYVSPISVSLSGYGTTTPGLLSMKLIFAPEPGATSMLLSGAALIALGGWARGKSRRR